MTLGQPHDFVTQANTGSNSKSDYTLKKTIEKKHDEHFMQRKQTETLQNLEKRQTSQTSIPSRVIFCGFERIPPPYASAILRVAVAITIVLNVRVLPRALGAGWRSVRPTWDLCEQSERRQSVLSTFSLEYDFKSIGAERHNKHIFS